MELDCKQRKLTVRNTTRDCVKSVELPASNVYRVQVLMDKTGDAVRIVDSKRLCAACTA